MKPGPKPLLGSTMSHAQRQARYRDGHADGAAKLRYRKPADHRSRPQRWRDAVAELMELQADLSDMARYSAGRPGGYRNGRSTAYSVRT
jgi:hypothetical protein